MGPHCQKCGCGLESLSDRGAYLQRASPVGELPALWECAPSCTGQHGGPEDALLAAVNG